MGNNTAYSQFEGITIKLSNMGKLDLMTLDAIAEEYRGMSPDSGGSRDLRTEDGKGLEEVCIELVDPVWKPVRGDDEGYIDPDYWLDEERYTKFLEIRRNRWRW